MVVGGNQVVRVGPGGPGMVQGQHVPRDSGCSDGLMMGLLCYGAESTIKHPPTA